MEIIGQEIYGYKVKDFLGKGNSGEAYSVEHIETKKIMAMKMINIANPNKTEYDNTVKKLEKEISTGLKLGPLSPFLLQLSEFFVGKSYLYIVMEFCSGGDLQKVFDKKNKLPKDEVQKLAFHLASGLKVLHNGETVHSALKPSSIFITEDGIYKIGNFGKACAVDLEKFTTIVGTTGYQAPEVLNGEIFDSKMDIFSLGCILYEAITGRNPFANESGRIIIPKNATANYQKIETSDCPSELIELCHAMLSLNPFDRPSAEDILQNPIFEEVTDVTTVENKLKQEIISLKKIIEEKDTAIKDKDDIIKEMRKEISDKDNTIKEMRKGINNKDNAIKEMKKEINDNNNTIENLNQENNQLKATIQGNKKIINEQNARLSMLQNEITQFNGKVKNVVIIEKHDWISWKDGTYACTKCGMRVKGLRLADELQNEECSGHM